MLREDMEEIVAGKAVCPVRTVSKQDYPVRPLLSGLASSGPTKPTALEMKLCAKKLRSNKLRHRPLLGQSACDRRSSAVQRTGGLHPFNRPWDFGTGCRQPSAAFAVQRMATTRPSISERELGGPKLFNRRNWRSGSGVLLQTDKVLAFQRKCAVHTHKLTLQNFTTIMTTMYDLG